MIRNNCMYFLMIVTFWLFSSTVLSITHYYHWSAQLFFGFWRTYSSLDPTISPSGETDLPAPRRLIFPHIDAANWRDYAAMNQWVLRSAFPSISTEFMNDWNERAEMGHVYVFDRVVLADRAAAMHGENFLRTQRTAANAFALPGSVNWWSTIRNNVVGFAGLDESSGSTEVQGVPSRPVITYISRQGWGRRMLIPEHHERLVAELYKLRDTYGYEVNIVEMDKLSRVEQFQLAGRTTVSICFSMPSMCHRLNGERPDHDGCAWEWFNGTPLDASYPSFNSHGVLLSRRLRT